MTMAPMDALRVMARHAAGAISVPTMTAVAPWHALATEALHVSCVGFMGGAASLGLGLALAQPGRRVIVLDGDGSLLMQLGALATVAGAAPANFYHFVFKNRVYQVSGSQPIPAGDRVDFAGLARAAGYAGAHAFDGLEGFAAALPSIFAQRGPVLVELAVTEMPDPPRGGVIAASFAVEAEAARVRLAGER